MSFGSSTASPSRRRDKILGMSIIAGTFLACLGLSLWAKRESMPELAEVPAPPTTEGLPGFPNRVKPWDLLERARSLTPRALFRGFVAEGVRADGTLDFTQPGTRLRYSFQSLPGQGPQPPREGGTLPERTYCGTQSVRVGKEGIFAEHDKTELPCPSKDPKALAVPEKCSIEDVWELAREKKLTDKPATQIEYFESKRGAAYRFTQGGRERFVVQAKNCSKELRGKERQGAVP